MAETAARGIRPRPGAGNQVGRGRRPPRALHAEVAPADACRPRHQRAHLRSGVPRHSLARMPNQSIGETSDPSAAKERYLENRTEFRRFSRHFSAMNPTRFLRGARIFFLQSGPAALLPDRITSRRSSPIETPKTPERPPWRAQPPPAQDLRSGCLMTTLPLLPTPSSERGSLSSCTAYPVIHHPCTSVSSTPLCIQGPPVLPRRGPFL